MKGRYLYESLIAISLTGQLSCTLDNLPLKQQRLYHPLASTHTTPNSFADFKPGQAIVKTEGKTETVSFSYKSPLSTVGESQKQEAFSTQNVSLSNLASIKLTLVGLGITGSLTNDGDVFVSVTNGTATANISNVPISEGKIRVVTVQGYDINNVALPAFVGKGFYTSMAGTTNITIMLNRRQLLTGLVLESLINSGSALANTLNTTTLQASVDAATGFNSTTNTFNTDPTKFDVADIVNLITTNGTVPTSTEILANATAASQNVTIHFKTPNSRPLGENVIVSINDPGSTPQTITNLTATPTTAILNVNPGTWNVHVKTTGGTLLAQTSVTVDPNGGVTVTAGQGNTAPNALSLTGVQEITQAVAFSFAGSGSAGSTNGVGTAAQFNQPTQAVFDSAGNLYVAEASGHRIRKINSAGNVSNFVGSGTPGSANGMGTAAQLNTPFGLAIDSAGILYVGEDGTDRIRKIDSAGNVSNFVGFSPGSANGMGTAAEFNNPRGMAVDSAGVLYVVDDFNHRIRKVDTAGNVTNFAGFSAGTADGLGTAAQFTNPEDMTIDSAGILYVADTQSHQIRKITTAGNVTTIAGNTAGFSDGVGTVARFLFPTGIAVDSAGNLYIGDTGGQRVRKIATNSTVTTLIGNGAAGTTNGIGTVAQVNGPAGLILDSAGYLFLTERSSHRVRKIIP